MLEDIEENFSEVKQSQVHEVFYTPRLRDISKGDETIPLAYKAEVALMWGSKRGLTNEDRGFIRRFHDLSMRQKLNPFSREEFPGIITALDYNGVELHINETWMHFVNGRHMSQYVNLPTDDFLKNPDMIIPHLHRNLTHPPHYLQEYVRGFDNYHIREKVTFPIKSLQ